MGTLTGEAQLKLLLKQGGTKHPDFWNPELFLPCLHVKTKQGTYVPFIPYEHQRQLCRAVLHAWRQGYTGIVHVKPRQEGATSLFTAIMTWLIMFQKGQTGAIISYKADHSRQAMKKCIDYYNSLPAWAQPQRNKQIRSRLEFEENRSTLDLSSVRADEPLRGDTVQWLMADEISSWAAEAGEDAWVSARNAIPDKGGFIFALSTPKGYGDQLHQLWEEAMLPDSKWLRVFIPWTAIAEYSIEPPPNWHPRKEIYDYANQYKLTPAQAYWMQTVGLPKCVGNMDRFLAEYPPDEESCWIQAGENVFDAENLRAHEERITDLLGESARIANENLVVFLPPQSDHRYLVSVDPASGWAKADYWAVTCWDLYTGEQMMEFWGHARADEICELLVQMRHRYNNPLVVIEANGVGDALLHYATAARLNVYWRDRTHPGWWASEGSRAQAIADCQQLLIDHDLKPMSLRLTHQLRRYRSDERREKNAGHFDLARSMILAAWVWKRSTHKRLDQKEKTIKDIEAEYRRVNHLTGGSKQNTPWGNHR